MGMAGMAATRQGPRFEWLLQKSGGRGDSQSPLEKNQRVVTRRAVPVGMIRLGVSKRGRIAGIRPRGGLKATDISLSVQRNK